MEYTIIMYYTLIQVYSLVESIAFEISPSRANLPTSHFFFIADPNLRKVMHEGCIYALTIGACARVMYAWSEAEALANVTRTSVFNEIHTMLTLKMPYEQH